MSDVILIKGERHTVTQCGSCGVWHTVPEIVYESHRSEGGFHSCPNGHRRGWDKGTNAIERENIRRERDRLKQDAARLADEIAAERARADAAEASTKRLKKRAAAGVCPCCNRSFANMQRHMKTKHPNIVPIGQKSA